MPPVDGLSSLLDRFPVRAQWFPVGSQSGHGRFEHDPGQGLLHVLRRGEFDVTDDRDDRPAARVTLREPSLLFYPRELAHQIHDLPLDGSDFASASIHFDGGERHPLARALPTSLQLPLSQMPGLEPTVALLFSETGQARCGQHLVADRLFEIVLIQLLRWLMEHPAHAGIPPGLLAGLAEPRLAQVLAAVHQAPGAAWTLTRMA